MKNKTLLSASLALMMALPMQAQQLKEYAGMQSYASRNAR